MLTLRRIFSLRIPFSQIPNGISTRVGKCLFSRYRKLSRESDYNDYRDSAEFVETSLFGDNFEQSVSALKHAKLIERRKHKFSVLQKKYSDNPIELSVLTWRAKIQIISLLNSDEHFDFEELSNLFPITAHGVRKLFRSKSSSAFQRSVDIRWLFKHDSQVIERWNNLLLFLDRVLSGEDNVSGSSLHSMIPFGLAWLFTNAKMNLLIYADGNPDFPYPERCNEIVKKSSSFGRFEIYAEMFDKSSKDEIYDKYSQLVLNVSKIIETFQKLKDVSSQSFVPHDSSQLYPYLLNCAASVEQKRPDRESISLPNYINLRDYLTSQKVK
ncbi:hypothetical protein MN116_004016 [Schistosoma mekongi]|uniref:Uncharacterized protein n=1 Tax=Schistosoma mekongi TaxID=38744 RepID=A0AAE1ZFJ4_SCHME|nr:hypothetical protein MN116_004016 [Schistosoma mekongi]